MFDRLRYGIRNTWQVLYIYTLMRLGVYKSTPILTAQKIMHKK